MEDLKQISKKDLADLIDVLYSIRYKLTDDFKNVQPLIKDLINSIDSKIILLTNEEIRRNE